MRISEKIRDVIGHIDRTSVYYKEMLKHPKDVYIFGAGENGRAVKTLLEENRFQVLGFIDNNDSKNGTLLEGVPVLCPQNLDFACVSMIVIASSWGKEIADQLRKMNFTEYVDFSFYFDSMYHSHFDLPLIEEGTKTILEMWEHLPDEESRRTFAGLLKYRLSLDCHFIHVSDYVQYNCPMLPVLQGGVVLDVGAWQGDTAIQFASQYEHAEEIVSFEPSQVNYQKLQEAVRTHALDKKVTPMNVGLGSKNEQVHFAVDFENTGRSNVSQSGGEIVQLLRLDEFEYLAGKKISMIKMDIEGAEFSALQGAKKTIEIQKPQMAISVYHHGQDLWRIWKYIYSIRPDYRFYMGHHSLSMFETILYAF